MRGPRKGVLESGTNPMNAWVCGSDLNGPETGAFGKVAKAPFLRCRIQLVFPGRRAYISAAMSLVEIEAELDQLGPDELRRLALKSWMTFVEKERGQDGVNECDEGDPRLLAALDEAIAKADATPGEGHSGREVRARLNGWTTG